MPMTIKHEHRIHDFILERLQTGSRIPTRQAVSDPFWNDLTVVGTELWLDTGDIDAASALWCREFTGLTTNNTLLNTEIQKGIYDTLIQDAADVLSALSMKEKIIEIAFILNAYHGLRLSETFEVDVSVELHTDLADDIERSLAYARRLVAVCPEHFIIKVPLTAAGLIVTRALRSDGIPVNLTLGFSARHNYLATRFAQPSYVNVFLGRLNAYIIDNHLGDANMVGEKTMLASQHVVTECSRRNPHPTRHIAASLRNARQLADLVGVDVYTIPIKVMEQAKISLSRDWTNCLTNVYDVHLDPNISESTLRLEKLWQISAADSRFADRLTSNPPQSDEELIAVAHSCGVADLFPRSTDEDLAAIADDGKIPKHSRWQARIRAGELAIDTLLNQAGLAAFRADQKSLDDRIQGFL